MSLIHTCQLCGTNPFDYLTKLQQHVEELSRSPAQWMPWNYPGHCDQQACQYARVGHDDLGLAENDTLRP